MLQKLSYIINVAPEGVPQVVKLSQNENGRTLEFTLTGAGVVSIPAGSTVTISGTKPDGVVYSATGTLSGNTVSFSETTQMTAVSGIWPAKIKVTYSGETIATCKVVMAIDPDPVEPGSVPSNSQLNGLVAEAQQYATYAKEEAYGSPLVAATKSAMTNTSRVYVYTGSETGMTAGHWYYYNGSAWTDGGVYNSQGINTDTTLTLSGMAADSKATGDQITGLKSELSDSNTKINHINDQITSINSVILPPVWEFGSRYVSNNADTYASTTARMCFKRGTYITLKTGDVVTKTSSLIQYFAGGYSTDNGSTFTAISVQTGTKYVAPVDGIYFFYLTKYNDAAFTQSDLDNGWKYLTFTRSGSMSDALTETNNTVTKIETAIGYEVLPTAPTDFYTLDNTGKGLNYLGVLVDDPAQDASDFIELTDDFYDMCRVVSDETMWSLGAICYYTASQQFIRRDMLGNSYTFSIYNGEKVVWLNVDKTVANAKYIRYCGDNAHGFKYWVVYNSAQATILDNYTKYRFLGKKIVNFGDSIFGITRPPKDISSYLAKLTGATVYNAGFGGCEMSNHADANYNPFSMCNLADAIATGTWTTQEAAASASGMPAYFAETVAMLKNMDFSTVDIITIGYGTNDWYNGSPLDNGTDTDKSYFADALRYSIKTILSAYPNLKVFVCTQTYRFFMDSSYDFIDDCTTHTNSHGKTLTDFVNKTIEVANAYNVEHIDIYHIGMNRYSRSYYFYSYDGTHPKPEGNNLIANKIYNELF